MKNKLLLILLVLMMPLCLIFSGCNAKIIDLNLTLRYAIINQNGQRVLHKVRSWADSESESVCIETECCHNYIWFSVNNSELYTEMPKASWYDCVC